MFSQLCRVGVPRTLWDRIAVIRQPAVDEVSRVGVADRTTDEEAARCQLQHCIYCDYRVDGERAPFHKEAPHLQSSDSCHEATENPAYGLSAKHWLEIRHEEDGNEEVHLPVLNATMESLATDASSDQDPNARLSCPNNLQTGLRNSASQQEADGHMKKTNPPIHPLSQSHNNQPIAETRHKRIDPPNERSKSDSHKPNGDQKHCGLSWSVLKHRQIGVDSPENCDKPNPCVIEHPSSDKPPRDPSKKDCTQEQADAFKEKRSAKDRYFPLSLMKPITKIAEKKSSSDPQQTSKTDISRQRPVHRAKFTNQPRRFSSDLLGNGSDPLSAIEQIKTEESIQEWLARISESTGHICAEDGDRSAWGGSRKDPGRQETSKNKLIRTETTNVLNKGLQEALEMSHGKPFTKQPDSGYQNEENTLDTSGLLCNASKASPANIPMVVMQCSRLHSHIGSKPPFQQTSLPMGTLVTALYQESDWMYVQTPHGVEGFIIASNCVPIGTTNDPAHTSRRPWEPCDFPIEINVRRQCEYARQQGAYVAAKLPGSGKHTSPYVSTVKMKTNFYSDRYFSHTFKSKDSIKTAKTVTDILRNSPETKVSNQ